MSYHIHSDSKFSDVLGSFQTVTVTVIVLYLSHRIRLVKVNNSSLKTITSKGFSSRTTRCVNSRSSCCNSPGKALHIGISSMALRRPVPEELAITDRQTDTHTHTRNTAINTINIYIINTRTPCVCVCNFGNNGNGRRS